MSVVGDALWDNVRTKRAVEKALAIGLDVVCRVRAWSAPTVPRLRPSFVIVGAQRCGTTSMYNYVTSHPHVVRALTKEVHYFDVNMARGWAWYASHFVTECRAESRLRVGLPTVTGEASPYYVFHPHGVRRLREALPNTKIIVMLRDPVQRALSHYSHERMKGWESASLEEALALEESRLSGEVESLLADETYQSFGHQHYSYRARGDYLPQLQRVHEHYPPEQVFLLNSNDFYRDPDASYRSLMRFLGLDAQPPATFKRYNTYASPKPDPAVVTSLVRHFAPLNEALYDYVGKDLGWSR